MEFLAGQRSPFVCGVTDLLSASIWELRPYVVSFSKTGNDLSQWREYGDRGAGFSIEFDYEGLSSLANLSMGAGVLDVTYHPELQREIIPETCKNFADIFGRWEHLGPLVFELPASGSKGNCEEHCRCHLISLLLTVCAAFKDPAFLGEDEARLVRLGNGMLPPKFRTGRFGITPYIEITAPSQKLPIKKIWQGPTSDRSFAESRLKALLKERGYRDLEFEVSKIPLR